MIPQSAEFKFLYGTTDHEVSKKKHNCWNVRLFVFKKFTGFHDKYEDWKWSFFMYGWERYDLLKKGTVKFSNGETGKGLFARKTIPRNTVLAYYPGDRISKDEAYERSSSRPESDRYVFEFESIGCPRVL